jgi:hypothetical protein
MSRVTNVILTCPLAHDRAAFMEELNRFDFRLESGFVDREEEDWVGGSKSLECMVFVGAFNWLDLPDLLAHLVMLPWQKYDICPEDVQLFHQQQESARFTCLRLSEHGQWEVDRQEDVDGLFDDRF